MEFWYEGPQLPEKVWAHTMFATRDVLYVFGGWSYDADDISDRIYYARINGDGSLGAWNTDTLPGSRYFHDTAVRGRDIYLIDGIKPGSDHATDRTIYRAPIAEDINVVKSWTSAGLNQQVLIDNLSLEAGRRYYFDVQTTNGGLLTSAVGATDGILAGMPVPPRVENLVVGNPGCGETLVLNWTAVSGDVIGYNIYQSTAATAGYIKVNVPVVDNTYTVEALKDGTEYFYRVAAVDSRLREGAKSLPASGVPADELPPSAVADFQAIASDETTITFCWTATGDNAISGDIAGGKYWIKYSAIEAITTDAEWNRAPYELIATTDTAPGQIETVAVLGLKENKIYYFALRLCDEAENWSAVSNCVSVKPGVDHSPPVSSLEFAGGKQHPAAGGYYASQDTKYKITAVDPYIEYVPSGVDFIEYGIDGGAWQVYTEPFGLAEGVHTIEYYGQDKKGNKEEPVKTAIIYVDNTAPEAQLVIADPKYEIAEKVYITAQTSLLISAIDPVISGAASGILETKYTVDKINWQTYAEPFYITDDGTYEINFSAEDNVGNKSGIQTSKEIVVDTIPPAFSGITVSSKIEAEDENNILDGCSGSLAGQGIILGSSNGENIALDKGYVYSIEPDVCYVGIAEILLTDGATGKNVGWEVGGNDSITVDIVVDLSAIFKTNKIRCNGTSIYYVPDRMEVYTSLDNVNFDYAGYSEETAAVTWMEIEFPAREARYVKFRLKQSGHGKPSWWLFVSELEIYEAIGLLEGTVETAWKNIHPDSQLTNFSPIQQLNQGNITYQYSTDGQIWSDVSALSQADTSSGKIKFIAELSRPSPESVSPYLDCIQFDMGDGIFVSPETAGLEPVTIKFMTSETLREEPVVKVGERYAGFVDFSDGIYAYNYIVTPLDLPGEYTITVEGTDIAGNKGVDTTGRIAIDWVDDAPPVSSVVLGEPADGDIIGMNTPVEIEASDDISGVKEIKYRFNSVWKTYTGSFTVSSANLPRTMTVPEINWSRLELPPEPNSLFVCSEDKIIKFNMFGEKELEVTMPDGTPLNLTYDSETKYIYIADKINNRIARTVDGSNWEFQYAHNVGWEPASVTIDKDKNLYVPSYYTIWKFKFGQNIGYSKMLFSYMLYKNSDIDYDPSEDMLYIAESYYGRIYKAKADGSEYVQGYGRGGATGIDFNSTDKSIYLADNEWNTIIRTNIDRSIRESIGAYGSGDWKFKHPWDVAIDEQTDILYVSDTGNNRLVKTKMDGSVWEVFAEVTSPKGIFFSIPGPKYMDVAQVIDADESVGWRYISWETSDDSAYLKTRTGNTLQPDEIWSDWSDNFNASTGTRIMSPPGRYLQIAAGIQDAGDILPEITNIRLDVVPAVTLSHYGVDLRGNIELAKQTLVYLDNLAPGSPNELVYEILNNNTVSIVWQLNLENDFNGYNLYRNGQKLNESCFSGVAYIDEDLSLGEYTYQLTAVDLFGNESEPSQISVSIADTVPPVTAFIPSRDFYMKDGKNYASDDYNYALQATDAFTGVDHIEVKVDEQEYAVYTDSIVFTTTGIHTIKYRAVDNAENWETEKSITIWVDATKPQTTAFFTGVYFETEGKFYITEQTQISFAAADPYINGLGSGLDCTEYRTNGGAWQEYTAPFTVSDNTNLLEFRSTDNVGNEEVVKSVSIGFDIQSPVTSVEVFGPSWQDEKLWISSLTPVGFETQDNTEVTHTMFKIGYADWDIYQSELYLAPEIKKEEYKDEGEAAWQSGELNDLKIDTLGNVALKEYPSYLFVAQIGKIVKISICNGIEIERETLDSLYVPSIPRNALSYTGGISHDPVNDFVYLTNTYCDGIIKTKMDGTEITTFGTGGSGINRFRNPYGIFYDPNSEYLYIADADNNRIVKTKMDGSGWQTLGGFNWPRDVYYDSSTDFVYIADYNNNRVVKTKMDGSEWTSLSGIGSPTSVHYDSFSEYVYVTEYLPSRIVKVKMNGQGKKYFGSRGSGQGQFYRPEDVYYDSNEDVIYVADTSNHRVVKTNMTGSVWEVSSGFRYTAGVFYESAEIKGFISYGEFVSRIVDAEDIAEWGLIEWQSQTPLDTVISLCTRTGNTSLPDSTWSEWSSFYLQSGSQISSPEGRFIQYKAVFTTNDGNITPSLSEVTLKIKEGDKDEFVISYYSEDIFGNQENIKTTVVKIDSIAPEAPQQLTYEVVDMTTVNFNWQANTETDLAGYYVYRDGDKLNDTPLFSPVYQDTKAIAGISQIYWITAVDRVGNESAPSQKVNVITLRDETAPVSTITVSGYSYISPDGNNYAALASSFSITAADDLSGVDYVEYEIDGGGIQRYQEPFPIDGEGEHSISYRAVDRAGNQESFSEYRIIIDSAAPFSTLAASRELYNDGEKYYANSDVRFILSSTDNLSGVKDIFVAVKNDYQTYLSSFTLNEEGTYQIKFYAQDNVNNSEEVKIYNICIDTTPPALSEILILPENSSLGIVDIYFLVSEPLVKNPEVTINGNSAEFISYASPFHYKYEVMGGDTEGPAEVIVSVEDFAGNKTANTSGQLLIDYTPPNIAVYSPLGGDRYITAGNKIIIAYDVSDNFDSSPDSRVYLTNLTEGATMAVYSYQIIKPCDISQGQWTMTIEAGDSAGNNISTTTAVFEVFHDILPPRTSLGLSEPHYWREPVFITDSTVITLTAEDDLLIPEDGIGLGVEKIQWRIDEGDWLIYEAEQTLTLPEGEHRIEYYSVDSAGNTEQIKYFEVVIDSSAPASRTKIDEPKLLFEGETFVTAKTPFVIRSDDNFSGTKSIEYQLNYLPFQPYAGSFTLGETQDEVFRDEFNAPELNQDWRWERGNAENRTLTEERENLIIYTANGSLKGVVNNQENILLRNMPVYGGRVVETKLEFNPEYEGQEAGIYIYQNDDNYIKLVKTEIDNKNYVAAAMEKNGEYSESISIDEFYEKDIYLRIRREETNYRLYYSTNALSWFKIKEFDETGMTAEAGIGACNGIEDIASGARLAAKFDYFSLYRPEPSNLSDGEYALSYYAEDNVGNKEEQKSITVTLDDSPPEIEIVSPVGGGSYIATKDRVDIVFNVSDAGPYNEAAYLTVVDADDPDKIGERFYVNSGDSIEPLDLPTYGRYKLTVEAIDWAGHKVTKESGSFEVLWDILPPRTELVSGEPKYGDGSNTFVTGLTTYSLTAVDDLIEVDDGIGLGVEETKWRVNGGEWKVYESAFNIPGADGIYRIDYYSKDVIGNTELTQSATYYLDNTGPETAVSIGTLHYISEGKTYISEETEITLSAIDPVIGEVASGGQYTEYRIDGGIWQNYSELFTLIEGIRLVEYRSIDNVNNTEQIKSITLYVDETIPGSNLVVSQPQYQDGANLYVTPATPYALTTIDPVAAEVAAGVDSTEYKVDGGEWAKKVAPVTNYQLPVTLTEGERVIYYRGTDNVENRETDKSLTVFVDDTRPETSLSISQPKYLVIGNTYITSEAEITLSAIDPIVENVASGVALTEYRILSSTGLYIGWTKYEAFKIIGPDGIYTIEYRSVDNVTNQEGIKTQAVLLDNTDPITQISAGSPQYLNEDTIYITPATPVSLSSSDPVVNNIASGVRYTKYRVGLSSWIVYSGEFYLNEGIRSVEYCSIDNLGNVEDTNIQVYHVDDTASESAISIGDPSCEGHSNQSVFHSTTVASSVTPMTITSADPVMNDVASGVEEIKWRIGEGGWETSSLAVTVFQIEEAFADGEYKIEYYSADNLLNAELVKDRTVILDNTAPEVYLTFPSTANTGLCQMINGTVTVRGTVTDAHLKYFNLDYREYNGTVWQTAVSTKEMIVENGDLGDWNTAGLDDGWYVLRLQAVDCVNNASETEVEVYVGQPYKLMAIGSKGKGDGEFNHPGYAVVDEDGAIYVSDTENGRVQKFSSGGEHLLTFGKGILNEPTGIAVDKAGMVYIADRNNDRVLKIEQTSNDGWQIVGEITGFNKPHGICVSSGLIYIADRNNDRIQVYDSALECVTTIETGIEVELNKPQGVFAVRGGEIYISDRNNDRVLVFSSTGSLKQKIEGFNKPDGVALNERGFLFVADSNNSLVKKYSPEGELVAIVDDNFNKPGGVAIYGGELYVVDSLNDRVVKYGVPPKDMSGERTIMAAGKNLKPSNLAVFELKEVYAYPNPAKRENPKLHFNCGVSDAAVSLRIFTIAGEQVFGCDMSNNYVVAKNAYEYEWDTSGKASGVYIYLIKADRNGVTLKKTGKMAVIK
ncbi:MAG: fibronectin type III domain-containing protein [Candidatus Omnitrophota bacterium]